MTVASSHLMATELEAGLADISRSPKDNGILEMIVRRPQVGEREELAVGTTARQEAARQAADFGVHCGASNPRKGGK